MGPVVTSDNRAVTPILLPLVFEANAYERSEKGYKAWLVSSAHYNKHLFKNK